MKTGLEPYKMNYKTNHMTGQVSMVEDPTTNAPVHYSQYGLGFGTSQAQWRRIRRDTWRVMIADTIRNADGTNSELQDYSYPSEDRTPS